MQKIKAIIVDDEPLARDNIKILLKEDDDVKLIGECRNAKEALDKIKTENIDLIFLDIQMPGLNGFEMLSQLGTNKHPIIIFITAFNQFALEAFKVHAIDYLLKPYTDQQFYLSLDRAKEYFRLKNFQTFNNQLVELLKSYQNFSDNNESLKLKYLSRFTINVAGKTYFVKIENVDWIEAADYYVQLHEGKNIHLIRESMNNIESNLDPDKFIRIHRSTIINIEKLKEIKTIFNGESIAILKDGTQLKVSRSRKDELKNKYKLPAF